MEIEGAKAILLSMSRKRILYYGMLVFAITFFCLLFLFFDFLSSWTWFHLEFHSTIETLGGISSILIALVFFQETREASNHTYAAAAIGFACMGVLDTFHAMSRQGDAFVFLHSAASLSGGFFFALIWLPHRRVLKNFSEQRWIAYGSVVLAISVGLRALLSPGDVPRILPLYNGKFTLAAVLINTLASLLFLVSVPKFYQAFQQDKNVQALILVYLALLFGIAEMTFQFSNAWNGIWWSWHWIRFAAFMITLVIVFKQYRQLSQESDKRHHPDHRK